MPIYAVCPVCPIGLYYSRVAETGLMIIICWWQVHDNRDALGRPAICNANSGAGWENARENNIISADDVLQPYTTYIYIYICTNDTARIYT